MQFGIYKCLFIPNRTEKNSCDYVLIIDMKKYDVAYHNYAEAKRTQVQKQFIQTLQVTLCVRSKQPIR